MAVILGGQPLSPVIAGRDSDETIHASASRKMDCFVEPCHRARVRATRWLAMTWIEHGLTFPAARNARVMRRLFTLEIKRAQGMPDAETHPLA
ncbi:MAG: hypothetical protein ACREDY_16130, partial [Bradyrhizobium sp.]